MMPQYGEAVIRERLGLDDGREIARYLKWEYGEGTGVGFLNGRVSVREPAKHATRFEFIERLGTLTATIKKWVAVDQLKRWGRELTLLAQWKRGELGTLDLIDRLEELDREAKRSGTSLSQRTRGEGI